MHLRATLKESEAGAFVSSRKEDKGYVRPRSDRRSLMLSASTNSGSVGEARVIVRDISVGGLLLTADPSVLSTDDVIEIMLPDGVTKARVVWQSGIFFGCQFDKAASVGAISAALLKSAPNRALYEPASGKIDRLDRRRPSEFQIHWPLALGISIGLWTAIIAAVYLLIL